MARKKQNLVEKWDTLTLLIKLNQQNKISALTSQLSGSRCKSWHQFR